MRSPIGDVARARRLRVVLLVAGALACGGEGSERMGTVVRDSAGVTIVENPAPGSSIRAWMTAESPTVRIGLMEGPEEYVLARVESALRLPNGHIVIADGGAQRLRFYRPDGGFLFSRGGRGAGPGEFESVDVVVLGAGDTIHVWDQRLRRVSVFSPAGQFERSIPISAPQGDVGFPRLLDALDDGRLLVAIHGLSGMVDGGIWARRDTLSVLLYAPDGTPLDTVGRWLGIEGYAHGRTGGPLVFGRSTTVDAVGSAVLVADNDRYEIRIHDADGELLRIVRRQYAPRPVTDADIERYLRGVRERAEGSLSPAWESRIADTPYPDEMPAFGGILVDGSGNLWVSDYRAPGEYGPRIWSVFGADGRILAMATTPDALRVTHVGEDWILGVRADDLGVQYVELHALERGPE